MYKRSDSFSFSYSNDNVYSVVYSLQSTVTSIPHLNAIQSVTICQLLTFSFSEGH